MSFWGSFKTFFEKVGAELEKLFGAGSKIEQQIQAVVTYVAPIVSGIISFADPAIAPLVNKVIAIVQADLATLSTVAQDTTITAGSTAAATAVSVLTSIKTNLSGLLQMAEVKNSAKISQITSAVNTVVAEVQAILTSLAGSASTTS